MRKIGSSEDKKRRQKRNATIMGVLLAGVLFLSVLGYGFGSREDSGDEGVEKVEYKGIIFVNYGSGAWVSETDPQIVLSNKPTEVPQNLFFINDISWYSGNPLYLSLGENVSSFFIYDNFNLVAQRIQLACFGENCGEDLPIKNCSNNLIIIEIGEEEVLQEEKCVFIRGSEEELSKVVDSFVLETFGIKQ